MEKTLNINIGGMIYHINEDAFHILNQYLEKIKDEIKDLEGSQKIINHIELRIAELIREKLPNIRQLVTSEIIQEIILIMGKPEDISGWKNPKNTYSGKKSYRRMFRDPDKRIMGGVCSGLGAYWNLDPTLIRVIFLILTIFGMAGAIIYLICWIVLPEARTAAQKMEMRGEEVTINSIIDFFKSEFDNVKRKFE
jgi:phage shock protein PspC (stress-responsive transcriptional regulator)